VCPEHRRSLGKLYAPSYDQKKLFRFVLTSVDLPDVSLNTQILATKIRQGMESVSLPSRCFVFCCPCSYLRVPANASRRLSVAKISAR
jgi:hypothetical protein